MKKKEYFERGRDAKTGRFITVKAARCRKSRAVVERVMRKVARRKKKYSKK